MLSCVVTSPTETVRHERIKALTVPARSGCLQILPGHAEAFIVLSEGTAVFEYEDGRKETLKIPDCECHVRKDEVAIFK